MSRLIDADALKEFICARVYLVTDIINSCDYGMFWTGGIEKAIDEQPTVEEHKTGRWIHDGFDHPYGVDWCHCSICGNRESVNSVYTQVDIYPYCAKCGAKMMEEKDETD